MKKVIRTILLITNIVSFALLSLYGASGIIYELFGPAIYDKMLAALGIPWNFDQIWLFMFVCSIVLIITYLLRKKFFDDL